MSCDRYYRDIFYDINSLPLEIIIQILKESKDICYMWWIDVLQKHSLTRKKADMSFEDFIKICNKSDHFVFIHRRGEKSIMNWRLEVGCSTMTREPDYFLWIQVDENKIESLVNKYNISIMVD